ncbi:hypothetical protein DICVIV_07003 [Dictyocaulus viviparus]|uniref:Heparan-sulfate 6-O-sulfotransferase n=1 Tax=Dictyocaulus viviparus TaxID=29172 RepID=A0A0D8XQJ6_DICVI|nr:hypothetical protein DICVIV_07003 [Dictyocaulus viviparus]
MGGWLVDGSEAITLHRFVPVIDVNVAQKSYDESKLSLKQNWLFPTFFRDEVTMGFFLSRVNPNARYYGAFRDDLANADITEKDLVSSPVDIRTSVSFQSNVTSEDTSFSSLVANRVRGFSIFDNDVLVFVHIQKTAGTSFEKFLVRHLNIDYPCQCIKGKKRCNCHRPTKPNEIWLFSRYSTGWLCGLHADFTELHVSGCVDRTLNKKEGKLCRTIGPVIKQSYNAPIG